jgi:uncharacterized OB-fold protein
MSTAEDMIDAAFPAPQPGPAAAPYWRALDEGRLVFQRCMACGNAWLPARSECPRCLAPAAHWETASGNARLVSWVVYHHGYHEYYATRLPYTVAVVELAEGPRLISNVIGGADGLRIDMPLKLVIQREAGVALARFAPG